MPASRDRGDSRGAASPSQLAWLSGSAIYITHHAAGSKKTFCDPNLVYKNSHPVLGDDDEALGARIMHVQSVTVMLNASRKAPRCQRQLGEASFPQEFSAILNRKVETVRERSQGSQTSRLAAASQQAVQLKNAA